ncbi:hypothetical protein LT493_22800 [Streptomyces tricolor]|nr:hypothetical protein [Streptomyces tricolor]
MRRDHPRAIIRCWPRAARLADRRPGPAAPAPAAHRGDRRLGGAGPRPARPVPGCPARRGTGPGRRGRQPAHVQGTALPRREQGRAGRRDGGGRAADGRLRQLVALLTRAGGRRGHRGRAGRRLARLGHPAAQRGHRAEGRRRTRYEVQPQNPALAAQLNLAAYRLAATSDVRDQLMSAFATPYTSRLTGHGSDVVSVSSPRTARSWPPRAGTARSGCGTSGTPTAPSSRRSCTSPGGCWRSRSGRADASWRRLANGRYGCGTWRTGERPPS